jgi:hypothetical protein
MKGITRFELTEARPDREEVLSAQGLPDLADLPARLRVLLEDAFEEFDAHVEPRAIAEDITPSGFEEVLDGFDGPVEETVIGQVYPRAEAFALYVATLGTPLAERIQEMFATNDLARGWMLDAVASSGADRLSSLLAARFENEMERKARAESRVLPYSPGYCGWTVRGQRRLFARLGPEAIGVTLNDSCLMTPIKSVSGVLVGGPGEIHRIRPDFDFCDECKTRACGARMASVLRR